MFYDIILQGVERSLRSQTTGKDSAWSFLNRHIPAWRVVRVWRNVPPNINLAHSSRAFALAKYKLRAKPMMRKRLSAAGTFIWNALLLGVLLGGVGDRSLLNIHKVIQAPVLFGISDAEGGIRFGNADRKSQSSFCNPTPNQR